MASLHEQSSSGTLTVFGPASSNSGDITLREQRSTSSASTLIDDQSSIASKAIHNKVEREQSITDSSKVRWTDNDPENPYNWPTGYKVWVTFQLIILAFTPSIGSSIIVPGQSELAAEFSVSQGLAVLNLSIYILGFALGPLIWAPISEIWGRRLSILPGIFILGLFSVGSALAPDFKTLLVMRFFSGVCGSAPAGNVSAALGDIFRPAKRGLAMNVNASMVVVGAPALGPLVGSAIIVNPALGWRWTAWILAIWAFVVTSMAFFSLPEVYGPVLLARRAKKLRRETNNEELFHPHEHMSLSPHDLLTKHFCRPIRMLTTEPTVMAITSYSSFVWAIMYMSITVYPYVWAYERGWAPIPSSLPILSLLVGAIAATGINMGNEPRYRRVSAAAGGIPVPEARFPPLLIGGVCFAFGLFLFAWTASPAQGVDWRVSLFAGPFIGAGFNSIFQQCVNALLDTYGAYSASAVGANVLLRSVLAAILPLVTRPMLDSLGVGISISIMGVIATLMIPVPLVLMKYGKALRKKSKFARELEMEREKEEV